MSHYHRRAGWHGRNGGKARAAVARAIAAAAAAGTPLLCSFAYKDTKCPIYVLPDSDWQVDHVTALADGGRAFDPRNWAPAHRVCNQRASAMRTNSMTKSKSKRLLGW